MGSPGIEHINITSLMSSGGDLVTALRSLIARLFGPGASTPSPGIVLYVPPGDLVLRFDGPLDLPAQVEVMFAPGGRLGLVGVGAELRIAGKLSAPLGPIFLTSVSTSAALSSTDRSNLCTVVLAGDRLDRVYPEWWGAGRLRSRAQDTLRDAEVSAIAAEDTEAIERALIAACDLRADPAVVELLGTYLLARTVRIGAGPFPPEDVRVSDDEEPIEFHRPQGFRWQRGDAQVELRGRLREPGDSTFRAASGFVGMAMFDIRGVASARIRGVGFDTRGEATGCVAIRDPFQFTVTDAPHELSSCSFRGASGRVETRALLRCQRSEAYGALPRPEVAHSAPNLLVEGCLFDVTSELGVAARLLGEGAAAAEFRGCVFTGESAAMVHASSFEVIAAGCRFQNESIPLAIRSAALDGATRARVSALHEILPEKGLDLYLDSAQAQPVLTPPTTPTTTPPRPPPVGPPSPSIWDILLDLLIPFAGPIIAIADLARRSYATATGSFAAPGPITPTFDRLPQRSVAAYDCRSTSPQFLATARGASRASMTDGLVLGLHHAFRASSTPQSPLVRPPAIHWRAAAGGTPVAMLLTGCRFDGVSTAAMERVVTPATTAATRPGLMEYGICDGDSVLGVTYRTSGVFTSGARVGFVDLRPQQGSGGRFRSA